MALESTQEGIAHILASAQPGRRRRRWLFAASALVVLVAVAMSFSGGDGGSAVDYKTAAVSKGELVATVSATGTLQPLNKVDVGSELSGTIETIEVDYNDRVKSGQVLARLDTAMLEAKQVEARATLQSAKAKQQDALATVTETRLALHRCEELAPRQMCAASDLDKLRAAYERAKAGEVMAKAQVSQAEAMLNAQATNLRKAVIRAPISGIVLARNVEKGQTVAASFQTPVLFTLAEDLSRMELIVAVDEADIGQVRLDQSATFTVDAYPGRTFAAQVTQIRQAPKTVDGVVTYETALAVANKDLALLPGMTATADIVSVRLKDAVMVPNAALRFTPPVEQEKRSAGFFLMRRPRGTRQKVKTTEPGQGNQTVYTLHNGKPVAVPVKVGVSDGRNTQVIEGEITPGMALITDTVTKP